MSFECRALNPRMGRHAFTLQRAQPPKKVNVSQIKALSNGAEIFVQTAQTGDLPLLQYILKYDVQDSKNSQLQTLIIPGSFLVLVIVVFRSVVFFSLSGKHC